MKDSFDIFIRKINESDDYLKTDELKDRFSYKIYARNAYAGIWIEAEKAFLISRYKLGPNPYLFKEYHWDIDEEQGTAKPLEEIELCPFSNLYFESHNNAIISYLEALEENHPLTDGFNSLQHRRAAAIKFAARLARRDINGRPKVWLSELRNSPSKE